MLRSFHRLTSIAMLAAVIAGSVSAHELIVRGTVAGIEKTRIQIKTGEEKADQTPAWYPIDAATKIKRGEKVLTFDQAKITVNERVVVIIDHPDKGPVKTKEIRLAAN